LLEKHDLVRANPEEEKAEAKAPVKQAPSKRARPN
jgi:hypothetical protein